MKTVTGYTVGPREAMTCARLSVWASGWVVDADTDRDKIAVFESAARARRAWSWFTGGDGIDPWPPRVYRVLTPKKP